MKLINYLGDNPSPVVFLTNLSPDFHRDFLQWEIQMKLDPNPFHVSF